ncbi:AzlD domain-containing protein [Paracoccus sp. S-4012]|uniref:AzlD domain-containing protein n=1 Tax=Paracoccus sp. S-4012 TaxID=2665648 RepID=UPI0012B00809|nr:AzlD domain-containing protein [Paracoccus sp. S-4012]MRX49748.1 AzlD domain-containing protein [Paracoccus sp. S-4012]
MSDATIWAIILILGMGTFLIRFSFLGTVGRGSLPPWALRLLRFTPVAVFPALIAPATVWPEAAGGGVDPLRLSAAALALVVGRWLRNTMAAMGAGLGALALLLWLGG